MTGCPCVTWVKTTLLFCCYTGCKLFTKPRRVICQQQQNTESWQPSQVQEGFYCLFIYWFIIYVVQTVHTA